MTIRRVIVTSPWKTSATTLTYNPSAQYYEIVPERTRPPKGRVRQRMITLRWT